MTREPTARSLRDLLFEQIEIVKNGGPEEIERARMIAELADRVVEAAKVQIESAKVYDSLTSQDARLILCGGQVAGLLPAFLPETESSPE